MLVFDIIWFLSFIIIQALPFVLPNSVHHPVSFFTMACLIGTAMLFSKKIKEISIVGKMLHWFAINVMKPRLEYNHIIWGIFILVFGVLSVVFYEAPSKSEIEYFNKVNSNYEFWLAVLVVFALNILAGLYTAKKHKK